MKISKRTREQAAIICAIAASSRAMASYRYIAECLGLCRVSKSVKLADAAWSVAADTRPRYPWMSIWSPIVDAEAEAMIREGWMP